MLYANLIPIKVSPPRVRDLFIERPRLNSRLDSSPASVVLVVGPAGSGKTDLLARWLNDQPEPKGWLSLTNQDDSLGRFIATLSASMRSIHPTLFEGDNDQPFDISAFDQEQVVTHTLGELSKLPLPWTLVIDDYQALSQPGIHAFVNQLIDVLPEGARLVIGSRTQPPLAIARRRLSGDLDLIGPEELAITRSECVALFTQHGIALSSRQLEVVMSLTTGWLVALHCIILSSQTNSIDNIIEILGSHGETMDILYDFLFQEVLSQQTPEMQNFLVQISILDRFSSDLCYALTGNPASGQLVEQMRRHGLFLYGLDEAGDWFQFQTLFGEFLHRQLIVQESPSTVRLLHSSAGNWFKRHNYFDEAIEHAVKAEDWLTAMEMIVQIASGYLIAHQVNALLTWVHAFPREVVNAEPNLASLVAYGLIRQGHGIAAEPFITAAEAHWEKARFKPGLALASIVRGAGARFREDAAGLIHHGVAGIELATGLSPLNADGSFNDSLRPRYIPLRGTWMESISQIISYHQLAFGFIHAGRILEAEALCSHIQSANEEAGNDVVDPAPTLAMLRLAQGRLEEAESIARGYAHPVADNLPTERITAMQVLSEVLYEWNRHDEAQRILQGAMTLLHHIGSHTSTPALNILAARISWARGDTERAASELDAASKEAAALQNVARLREADAWRTRFALAVGDTSTARDWVIQRGFTYGHIPVAASLSEVLVYARVLVATGEAENAAALLESLRPVVEERGAIHELIHLRIVESLAYLDLYELDHAVEALGAALEIGESGTYLRAFIDEGEPMFRLMRVAHRRGVCVGYIREVLLESGQDADAIVRVTHREIVEPITSREIEVLRFIALGLRNKDISEELYLSVATVKRHITNLYGKLGVSNRTEAVQRARKLGLLTADSPAPSRQKASSRFNDQQSSATPTDYTSESDQHEPLHAYHGKST